MYHSLWNIVMKMDTIWVKHIGNLYMYFCTLYDTGQAVLAGTVFRNLICRRVFSIQNIGYDGNIQLSQMSPRGVSFIKSLVRADRQVFILNEILDFGLLVLENLTETVL